MTEATCKRELELEIPAENVKKATEKISRDLARVARIPGFRPGKAPITLIQRRFADEIKGEVLDSLLPEVLSQSLQEKKMSPVNQPSVDQVNFTEEGPVKFRATFEVLPEFELADYKGLEIDVDKLEVGDAEDDKAIEEIRERAATFAPVEGRVIQDGDFAQLKLIGTPEGGGEPVRAESVLCHIGAEETLESFTENLRGANVGDTKTFPAKYPDDYPDPKLSGKTYDYTVEVLGIKEKKLPELNDEFAKDVAGEKAEFKTLDEMRAKVREQLDAAREAKQGEQAREKILEVLIKKHDFPVPESLIEGQMDARLERVVRTLATQGVDPRAVNVDWVSLRSRQKQRATDDVKAEILLDRIATAENIDATDDEVEKQLEAMAAASGESATSLRARLTKQGALDRMKSKLRSDKTIEWLYQQSRIQTVAKAEKQV
jgi:trigger factor